VNPEPERLVHNENAELRARLQALESSARQHAGLFYTLVEQAPIGVYVVDAEFRLRQVNALALPAFARVPECIGRDFTEVMSILWGAELAAQISGIFRNTLETGERYVSPRFVKHRQDLDEEKGYEWESQRVTLPDGSHCVVCYFSDITERVQSERALRDSEERTRLAAEATGVGIWQWNLKTDEILWDAQTFRIYGLPPTPDGKVSYRAWRDALLPQDVAAQEQLLEQTIQGKGPGRREFCIRRPGESICRHIQAIDTVRRNSAGKVEWIVGTNLDITEQRRTEKTLIDAKAAAESASRSKDRLLASLSHELRAPLMPVLIAAESLREDARLPSDAREQLAMIERGVALEARLIDDLLDISLVSQGKLKLRAEPVDAHAQVERAVAMVREEAAAKKVAVDCALAARLTGLRADPSRFQQVVWNLVRNAVKFTPEGGTVTVRTQDKTGKDGKAIFHLEVVDTGIGIEGTLLERIFEPFEQGTASGNHRFGGLGLGLSIARAIVTLHGARIWAESDGPGCGATIMADFPDAGVWPGGNAAA
jgi:signal transduction histidine kinase